MNKICGHCGYQRKREQRVKGSACPRCKRKPVSFAYKLKKAWRAFQEREYQPRRKEVKLPDVKFETNYPCTFIDQIDNS